MTSCSDASLGDLLRVRAALSLADPQEIREAAALLGLPVGRPAPWIVDLAGIASHESVMPVHAEGAEPKAEEPALAVPRPGGSPQPVAGRDLMLRFEGRVPVTPPSWAGEGALLEKALGEDPLRGMEAPPLLAPASSRALLAATVAGEITGGTVDLDKAVALLARGLPLFGVPRRLLTTLRFGVQILVDRSPSMIPFRADQRQVVADLLRLVGPDRVKVLRFDRFPWRVGAGTPRTWRSYTPPAPGTTVLVLGDLGLCRGDTLEASSMASWPTFAQRLRRAGCRPAALVPYPPERWPSALRAQMKLVFWDRGSTVAQARHARREAR